VPCREPLVSTAAEVLTLGVASLVTMAMGAGVAAAVPGGGGAQRSRAYAERHLIAAHAEEARDGGATVALRAVLHCGAAPFVRRGALTHLHSRSSPRSSNELSRRVPVDVVFPGTLFLPGAEMAALIRLGCLYQPRIAAWCVRRICCCWLQVLFFEHEFRNPSATDAVFVVETSSPDLVLVTDAAEWRVLRVAARLPGGAAAAEDDAVAQGNRLFLVGGETVRVPFKFLSLDPAAHMGPAFQVFPSSCLLDASASG
jgi:hypothetical protein